MTIDKIEEFDFGLKDITSLLNYELGELKYLNFRIYRFKNHLLYNVVFIHKSKWPVRRKYLLKDKKLFYQITAGSDIVKVPCGEIIF